MFNHNTIDNRSDLPKELNYEALRFHTYTGRAFVMSCRNHEKKYGYRHGVETPIGDVEKSLWGELMKELITQNGDSMLFEQLFEWYQNCPLAGRTKLEREQYVLRCFSHKLFDDENWADFVPFNQKYRPNILTSKE